MPVYNRVMEMAKGAAILANVDYKVSLISGIYEVLVNREGGKIVVKGSGSMMWKRRVETYVSF